MKKILSVLLVFVCLAGLVLSGCSKGKDSTPEGEEFPNASNHKIVMAETTDYIVEDGSTDYKILIPESSGYNDVSLAASELQTFLREATHISFEIVEDDAYSNAGKYISLGNTKAAVEAGVSADYDQVDAEGFIIKTVGDDIYITGATEKGTLNGVYGFLEHTLHFDYFFEDSYYIDTVTELPLYSYDVMERPDISVRGSGYGYATNFNTVTERRYRVTYRHDFLLPVTSSDGKTSSTHTSMLYISENEYGDHEDWFAVGTEQLCYTARDREGTEYKALVETAAQSIYDNFDSDVTESYYVASFSLMDAPNNDWCTCEECTSIINQYGANSATLILFLNDVAECLKAKFAATQAEDENDSVQVAHAEHMRSLADRFILTSLTYRAVESAPYTVDAEGNKNFSDNMKLHPQVAPFYAPIFADYNRSFYESEEYEVLKDWSVLSDRLFFWTYDTVFSNSFLPFYSYNYLQDLYQASYEAGTYFHYNQAQYFNKNSTGWAVLNGYLNAKLSWNCCSDVAQLTRNFFRGMYGSEWEEMYDIFRTMLLFNRYQRSDCGYTGLIYSSSDDLPQCWPRPFVINIVNRMYDTRDRLAANGETVEASRIELELVSPLYLLLKNYESTFNVSVLSNYKTDFRAFIDDWGISQASESASMATFLSSFLND